ncbi:TPA: response regulator transcription factor [Citrobacter youngae]|uniref:Transcriptional regulator RcsB n=1 Tax=Citrobacter youngae TaxID=133448 RepID=A0A9Q7ZS60_9ENTR|nr:MULTISPECIES: response regulator transcription factor [Citrobacter]TKU09552.1 response regulator transcription factor [Citrobacter sp. wls828]MBJ8399854.1 response regulator transcription factor [Citrobacter youngae]MBJ8740678.1 response regulator transcription factor [Citrobacter sp. FDAARGOS_156]MBJ8883245.1 response regulator transcription factor [Citrobacter sp. FDAARGOS_156]MBJ8956648.1 response regulator transcription factor [Citrobacter youngae]
MSHKFLHSRLSVAVASDEPIVITGLRSLLAGYADIAFVTHSRNELIHALSGKCDDKNLVLIVDVSFDCQNNNDASHYISRIQKVAPELKLIALVSENYTFTPTLRRLRASGVHALISKKDDLERCLPKALSDLVAKRFYSSPRIQQTDITTGYAQQQSQLTSRELEIIRLYARGMRVKEIANLLKRSVCTVAVHKHNAMQKLAITSNIQLLHYVQSQDTLAGMSGS